MVKKAVLDQENDGVSFNQFADEIGAKPERLVEQFKAAGINITGDLITQEQKQQLLKYLQQQHGAKQDAAAADKIVLRRAKTSEIKIGGTHGTSKTVSIQVRKKRTYVKRPVVEEETPPVAEPIVEPTPEVLVDNVVELTPVQAQVEEVSTAPVEPVATESENKESVTPAVAAESASGAPAVVEQKPVDPDANKTEEEKAAALKRSKEKHKTPAEEEQEAERNKKKKKTRDTTREPDRKFESLLARGADLGRVFKQVDEDSLEGGFRRGGKGKTNNHGKVKTQAFNKPTSPMKRDVEVPETITLSDLAQRMSVKAAEVIKVMMKMGVMATINQAIDQDVAILVVEELGHRAKAVSSSAVEDNLLKSLTVQGDKQPRPPVITIMGHVDHGKTTLLDYIRTTKVAASEAGGITQHIGAYHVQTQKGTITFLDTPGHAAFTAMRARGAKLTDIVILVVAADDGVMPQTVEAIQHAKAAGVPIVIAVNKMDKHGVDPDRVKTELSKNGVVAEDWGGDTMFVPISAKTGMGVDDLLDSILIQAEVLELKAVVDHPANGVVIESRLDRGRGAVMSVLVQEGTLRKGDIILAGLEYGRIRALFDENGKSIQSAGPSIPVEVLGLSGMTQAGDDFIVVPDEKRAREVASFRQAKHRETKMARTAPSMEDFMSRMENQKSANVINVVLKADVLGSAEALKQSLLDLSGAEVRVNIVSSGIGGLNESDVNLAIASGAIIVAFNVRANVEARKLIETNKVDVHYYNIIYDAINQVKKIMSGTLAPEIHEKIVGLAQVREVFRSSKTGAIAGCMVLEGHVKRNFPIRVLRDNVVVFEGALESLRRFKEDVADVRAGMECGIAVKSYNDIKAGDQIEVFEKIEVKREI